MTLAIYSLANLLVFLGAVRVRKTSINTWAHCESPQHIRGRFMKKVNQDRGPCAKRWMKGQFQVCRIRPAERPFTAYNANTIPVSTIASPVHGLLLIRTQFDAVVAAAITALSRELIMKWNAATACSALSPPCACCIPHWATFSDGPPRRAALLHQLLCLAGAKVHEH